MSRALAMLIIGLIFGGGIGFVLAASSGATLDSHDHATDHDQRTFQGQAVETHDHGSTVLLPMGPNTPTIAVRLHSDLVSGWNLEILTTDFSFAPENAGHPHVAGEGHAHLYVNGSKTARLYGPWTHIDTLPEGVVNLKVTLNTNDHKNLAVGDKSLSATITLMN